MKRSRFFKSFSWLLIFCLYFSFFMVPAKAQSLSASPSNIEIGPDKKITVTFSGAPGEKYELIGLYKAGESSGYIAIQHLNGKTSGTLEFAAPHTPGSYEFILWAKNQEKKLATSNPVNIDWGKVNLSASPSKINIGPNKKITVTFSGAPGYRYDYIGLYKAGESSGYIAIQHLKRKTSGTFEFAAPHTPGSYEFILWASDYETVCPLKKLATSNPVNIDWGPVSMKVNLGSPDKRKLSIQFSGAPGYRYDAIALVKVGDTKKTTFKYLETKTRGTIELVCPTDTDSYAIQLWGNGWTIMLAQTQAFIPKNGPPPPVNPKPDDPPPSPPAPPSPPPSPDKPFTLRARPGDGKVLLEWTPPQDTSNVIGYNLYRNTFRIPYGSPITDFPIKGLSHIDHNVDNGMKACYYMKAVYSDKTESSRSNEVCVTPGDSKITILLTIGSKNAYVNKQLVVLDVPPFIDSGRTFVPFRFIGESLGAVVGFSKNASGRVDTVTYSLGTTNIVLYIGKREATVNGKTVYLDVAPQILQGRTVIPLRFVTEALGCKVEWDGQKMQVTIVYPA